MGTSGYGIVSAGCPFLDRRLSSLLHLVDRAVSPLMGQPPPMTKDRQCTGFKTATATLGDVTRPTAMRRV